jgi:hypothetical protein
VLLIDHVVVARHGLENAINASAALAILPELLKADPRRNFRTEPSLNASQVGPVQGSYRQANEFAGDSVRRANLLRLMSTAGIPND